MNKYTLSFLIPANCEMFLNQTIQDLLANTSEQSEIIAVLDGSWAAPTVPQHPRVKIIYIPESIGQRAATNLACTLSRAKFVCKLDAHCSFDKDFDKKMLEAFEKVGDNVTMVPIMRNLWAFDWKCMKCGKRTYQGPTPTKCLDCDNTIDFKRKMKWKGKKRPQSKSYCFDSEPHFQYFNEYTKTDKYKKDLEETGFTETMSLQGSCFMCTRENYWKWEICDEKAGSWGNQGLEVACATWLSGGKVLVCQKSWYSHMFRTQGGDFSFPYDQSGRGVQKTKQYIKDKFWNFKHPTQIYPVSWLIDRFFPVKGWTQNDIDKLKENEHINKALSANTTKNRIST